MKRSLLPLVVLGLFLFAQACSSSKMATDTPSISTSDAPNEAMSDAMDMEPATASPMSSSEVSPEVQAILTQYYEARGGLEAIKGVESITQVGDMEMQGMQLPLMIYIKRPGMMRTEIEVPQMSAEFFMGFDGERGWVMNPMQGPGAQETPPSMTKQFAEQSDIDGLLVTFADRGLSLSYEGTEDIRGSEAHKLVVERPDNSPLEIYLDADTYLEVMVKGEGADMQSGQTVTTETYLTDYREVHGMMIPFKLEIFANGNPSQVIMLSDVVINDDMDASLFAFPEN